METGSASYLIFAAAVFFVYWLAAGSRIPRLSLIFLANLLFCAQYSPAYVVLLPVCATLDFLVGLALPVVSRNVIRKLLVGVSLAINLALIGGLRWLANPESHRLDELPVWFLALPLGLSFYALQSMTYTFDVYRRDAEPVSGLLHYVSAATFFPTLEAGPITRLSDLIAQLSNPPRLRRDAGGRALLWIALGVAKKTLVADYLGANLVNRVFDTPKLYSGLEVLVAIYAYSLQIYYDFSGYTDIARGVALLIGIQLPANFNRPYAAANLTEFWRRWHMSFSNWLRDYLYFSLPGGRTRIMPYINLVITMVIAGLWHGISATFALWGLAHGVGLALTRAWLRLARNRSRAPNRLTQLVAVMLTYHFVCLTWILFRSSSLENAWSVVQRILSLSLGSENLPLRFLTVLGGSALALCIGERWRVKAGTLYGRSPVYVHAAVVTALIIAIQLLHGSGSTPFVYSRF